MSDTIYALSSGRPPAAIAVIRISGPMAREAAAMLAGPLPEPRTAALRALRHPQSRQMLDEALVLRFDAPASATGEDVVELHCHGGRAVVDALLATLSQVTGLREARPGEFTRRAFERGRIDLTEAEGLADLLEAETESQRKAALALAEGGLKRQVAAWQERLLQLSAAAELAIDYVDDDDDAAGYDLPLDAQCLRDELRSWLERPRVEPLKGGARVVVAGPPNSGKSSLINAIAGADRAIVTDIPGTTRDQIEVPLAIAGLPVVLTDTAGLRAAVDPVEAIGIARAEAAIVQADVLIWLGDDPPPPHPRTIAIHARCDLPGRDVAPEGRLPVSAVTGSGVGSLLEAVAHQVEGFLPADDAVALNRRQFCCIEEAAAALERLADSSDLVIVAEELRVARSAFDRLTGRAGVEDLLDVLFSRFCLGK